MTAWANRNVMTDAYTGRLTVVDDDPTPRLTVTPVARSVAEGEAAAWRIALSKPVDYDLFVNSKVVRGTSNAPALTAGDVTASWINRHLAGADLAAPLWMQSAVLYDQVRSGSRELVISIPTRRDGEAEGRESLTLKVKINRQVEKRTVFVKPSA